MDGKIIKRLSELEAKKGKIEGVFIIVEATGKITLHGKEYTREQYENICKENRNIVTIIDNIQEEVQRGDR